MQTGRLETSCFGVRMPTAAQITLASFQIVSMAEVTTRSSITGRDCPSAKRMGCSGFRLPAIFAGSPLYETREFFELSGYGGTGVSDFVCALILGIDLRVTRFACIHGRIESAALHEGLF